jgi:hypothetical protein
MPYNENSTEETKMEISFDRLKKEFEENPVGVMSTFASAAVAVVGIGNMVTGMRNSRTWKKEVNRRTKMSKK